MGSQPTDARLHQACKMPLVAAPAPAAKATRKPSLKEQPSYLKEVSVALHRGEELKKLKEKLSSARLIMEKDPSAKPWMFEQVHLQLQPWGKIGRRQDQAKERV